MADLLFDTNAISAVMRSDPAMAAYLRNLADCRLLTSVVVEGELRFGILRLPQGRRRSSLARTLIRVLAGFHELLPLTRTIARRYARLKSHRWTAGRPVAENDLWIAATALAEGLILVSHDSDLSRIPGLTLEDWC